MLRSATWSGFFLWWTLRFLYCPFKWAEHKINRPNNSNFEWVPQFTCMSLFSKTCYFFQRCVTFPNGVSLLISINWNYSMISKILLTHSWCEASHRQRLSADMPFMYFFGNLMAELDGDAALRGWRNCAADSYDWVLIDIRSVFLGFRSGSMIAYFGHEVTRWKAFVGQWFRNSGEPEYSFWQLYMRTMRLMHTWVLKMRWVDFRWIQIYMK